MTIIRNFISILRMSRSERARIRAAGYRVTLGGLWTSAPRVTLVDHVRHALEWRRIRRQPAPTWTETTRADGRKVYEFTL